jgi:CDP-glucose 4,6-dehydratase
MNKNLNDLKKFWKGKRVLITGHTGFKGSWLSIFLNMLNAKIFGFSLKPKKNSLFNLAKCNKFLSKNIYADINNYNLLKKNIQIFSPEIIFHLAAQPLVGESFKNPIYTLKTNTIGTANLLHIIRNNQKIKSVVIVTTDKVYKVLNDKQVFKETDEIGGKDPYSVSKACAELVTKSFIDTVINKKLKNKICTVRSGNVIGGGDYSENRLLPDIIESINKKKLLIVRNPKNVRPWQHVIEPIIGYLKVAKMLYCFKGIDNNPSWNFGPGEKNFVNVMKIVQIVKKNKKKINIKVSKSKNFYETKILMLNSNKSKTKLKWKPKWSLELSIKKVLEWNDLSNKKIDPKNLCENQIKDYLTIK